MCKNIWRGNGAREAQGSSHGRKGNIGKWQMGEKAMVVQIRHRHVQWGGRQKACTYMTIRRFSIIAEEGSRYGWREEGRWGWWEGLGRLERRSTNGAGATVPVHLSREEIGRRKCEMKERRG